jgi:ATP-dependent helicase/nuclease subunit A
LVDERHVEGLLIYVAATRARDLLVIPRAGAVAPGKLVCGDLPHDSPPGLVQGLEPDRPGVEPAWAQAAAQKLIPTPADAALLARETGARWAGAAAEAARPRYRPTSVTGEAKDDAELQDSASDKAARRPLRQSIRPHRP